MGRDLNHHASQRIHAGSKALKASTGLWRIGQPMQGARANGTRATASDELVRLRMGGSPWRANPGRGCGVKQTHEAVGGASRRGREKRRGRNKAGLGSPRHVGLQKGPAREWTPTVCRDGEEDPKGGACSWEAAGGRGSRDSEGERSAREDEPTAQVVGDGDGGRPRRPVGNDDVMAGSGNPMSLVHHRSQDSKRS